MVQQLGTSQNTKPKPNHQQEQGATLPVRPAAPDIASPAKEVTETLKDALRKCSESKAESAWVGLPDDKGQYGIRALETLLKDTEFAKNVTDKELVDFLGLDHDSIKFLVDLATLKENGVKGLDRCFKAALRTSLENQNFGRGRDSGNFAGHMAEVQLALLLLNKDNRFTNIEMSKRVEAPINNRKKASCSFDIVAERDGKKYYFEVKNSVQAFFKSNDKGDNQFERQIYLASYHGAELVLAIAEGRQWNPSQALKEAVDSIRVSVASAKLPQLSSREIVDPRIIGF